MEGIPEELIQAGNEEQQDVTKDKSKRTSSHKGNIMVTIITREGLCLSEERLRLSGAENTEGLSINCITFDAYNVYVS